MYDASKYILTAQQLNNMQIKIKTLSSFKSNENIHKKEGGCMFSLLLKELIFEFYLPSLQLVLCRVAAVKRLPVHQP